ncbi:MAG: WbqC family protein [Nitrospirae bacterium]|nr:WbqC family protein [Nitrospirota bacterium]
MILTAHQPVYLPWLGLFHKIALADAFVSFNQVQYLPKDWNNRNRIKTRSGPIWLTVPVLKAGHREKTIKDIRINNSEPWRRKHWKSIQLNYSNAPHFDRYASFFEDVYNREWENLTDLNEYMLKFFLDILGIKVDFRDASQYNFEGVKSGLVLDMCKKLNADVYIFGELGRDYADEKAFELAGVKPVFQEYKHPSYPQVNGDFISHLSILDLLFNCGGKSLEILMEGNMTKEDLIKGRYN